MIFTNEEIEFHSSILKKYEKSCKKKKKSKYEHENCKHKNREIIDYKEVCCDCGLEIQRILSHVDISDWERCCYRRKSVYHRKYYFEKKIEEVQKKIDIESTDILKINEILYKIDNERLIKKLKTQFKIKRIINIIFIIEKILVKLGYKNVDEKIPLKISEETEYFYNIWWDFVKKEIKLSEV